MEVLQSSPQVFGGTWARWTVCRSARLHGYLPKEGTLQKVRFPRSLSLGNTRNRTLHSAGSPHLARAEVVDAPGGGNLPRPFQGFHWRHLSLLFPRCGHDVTWRRDLWPGDRKVSARPVIAAQTQRVGRLVDVLNLRTKTRRYGSLARFLGLMERGCVRITLHCDCDSREQQPLSWASLTPDASPERGTEEEVETRQRGRYRGCSGAGHWSASRPCFYSSQAGLFTRATATKLGIPHSGCVPRTRYRGRGGNTTARTLTVGALVLATGVQVDLASTQAKPGSLRLGCAGQVVARGSLVHVRSLRCVSNRWTSGHLCFRSDTSWPPMESGTTSSSVARSGLSQ